MTPWLPFDSPEPKRRFAPVLRLLLRQNKLLRRERSISAGLRHDVAVAEALAQNATMRALAAEARCAALSEQLDVICRERTEAYGAWLDGERPPA